jgi:hypothetical protein
MLGRIEMDQTPRSDF